MPSTDNRQAVAAALRKSRGGRASIDPDPEPLPDVPEAGGAAPADDPLDDDYGQEYSEGEVLEDVGEEGEEPLEAAPTRSRRQPTGREQAEAPDGPTSEEIATWQRQAQEAEQLINLSRQNPAYLASMLMRQMTPEQQEAVMAQYGVSMGTGQPGQPQSSQGGQAAEPQLDTTYDQLSVSEKLAWDNRHFLQQAPAKLKEMESFQQQVQQEFQRSQSTNLFREYEMAVLSETVAAIGQALGIELPAPDINEVDGALRTFAGDVKKAVSETYGKKARAAAAIKAKAARERPRTPGNGSEAAPTLRASNGHVDLREIIRYQAEHGRLPPLPNERF